MLPVCPGTYKHASIPRFLSYLDGQLGCPECGLTVLSCVFPPPATQEHIYKLMKSDSYARFLRSNAYQDLLSAKKKVSLGRAASPFLALLTFACCLLLV